MVSLDALRLARAKAMYEHRCLAFNITALAWEDFTDNGRRHFYNEARAIEAADAVLGVVSVPVSCDIAMVLRAAKAWEETKYLADAINAATMASPLAKENSDE